MTILVEFKIHSAATNAAEWLAFWQRRTHQADNLEHGASAHATALNQGRQRPLASHDTTGHGFLRRD